LKIFSIFAAKLGKRERKAKAKLKTLAKQAISIFNFQFPTFPLAEPFSIFNFQFSI